MPGEPAAQNVFGESDYRIVMHEPFISAAPPGVQRAQMTRRVWLFARVADDRKPGIALHEATRDPAGFIKQFHMLESGEDFLPQNP